MSWEDTFRSWGGPPGQTEKEKMENTENAIKNAIKRESCHVSNCKIHRNYFPKKHRN